MGRKSHAAAKNMEASPGQCTNPPSDLKESQPESAIPVLRNENTPLRQPGFSADQVASTVERSPVVETNNLNPETQQNVSKSRKKKPKIVNTVVRRSMRVQNAIVTASSLEVEPIVEHVTIDDDPVANDTPPERNFGAMTLEEKLNHALHKLEEQEKVIDTLQSKIIESSGMDEISSAGNVRYRSMYIESQKRVSEHLKECFAPVEKMLKIPDNQVAGHLARDGLLGPLVDDAGHFLKPLQNGERGSKELTFYTSLAKIPDRIRRYFPEFRGTKVVEASDGSGLHPHLVLQDITSSYTNPSIIDLKIGSRTWYAEASEEYIQKCLKKDRGTSGLSLGFRISGLQIHDSKASGVWKPHKKRFQNENAEGAKTVLTKFVSSNASEENQEPDGYFASMVYGGSGGILEQLLDLKTWFEDQTIFHFYSCSIMMLYEQKAVQEGKSSGAVIKLVDFAHVVDGKGAIDHNFLGGLCSLIKFISDILSSTRKT